MPGEGRQRAGERCRWRWLQVRPRAQQVVIDPSQPYTRRFIRIRRRKPLYRVIHVKQHRALPVIAHHALHPEETSQSRAARDGIHAMQAAGRIQDHVASGEFHGLRAIRVFDQQVAAVVAVRWREEEGGGWSRRRGCRSACRLGSG